MATEFGQDEPGLLATVMRSVGPYILRTAAQGADTAVWLATTDTAAVPSGSYCQDRTVRTPWGHGTHDAVAAALWQRSEQMTGIDAQSTATTPAAAPLL